MGVYEDIKQAAFTYCAFELPIIPLCSSNHRGCSDNHKSVCNSPGKTPVLKAWSKHMQTTEDDLDEWFDRNRYMNIGLKLGQTTHHNLIGIDIDGELGAATFETVSKGQIVPHTWEFTSGNGRRLLYQLPNGIVTKKNRFVWKEGHEELAFLAEGQQTVLPPSQHANGKQYKWVELHAPTECDIAMAPQWILDIVTQKVSTESSGDPEDLPFGEQSTPVVLEENMVEVREGGRSNYLARIVGSLCAKRNLSKEVIIQTAMTQNRKYCKPPLTEPEVSAMVETIFNSEMEKHQKILQKQRKRQEMHPAALTEKFMTILNNTGVFWKYNETKGQLYETTNVAGPWSILSYDAAQARIHSFLLDTDASMAKTSMCKELYQQAIVWSIQKYGDGSELNLGENPYAQFVCVNNGVLDWKTGELKAWEPSFNHTVKINADWIKEEDFTEEAKFWDDALHTWLREDDTIKFLQEYIGYSLLPSCKMRTAVFLHGEGANGKSLFLDAVHSLFAGTSMITQPTALAARFGTVSIVDKLLIMCSDIDSTYLDKTGVLKQLIAGDAIRAEYKGGKEFNFTPVGHLLFSANKLPKSSDKSLGWYSRLQFVHFSRTFKPDPHYYETFISRMTSETGKAVLLKWAIEGLRRLHANNCWSISNEMTESKDSYRKDNDNVLGFISEQLEKNPLTDEGYKTALILKAVYQTYKEWCEEQGVKPVGQPEFTQRIGSDYQVKSLRWKAKGGWKSQSSILNARFKEGEQAENFNGKESYNMCVNLGY